jgi:hypothetical protein
VIYEHGEACWIVIDRGKFLIRPQELSGNEEEVDEGNYEFSLRSIFVHTSKRIAVKSYGMGLTALLPPEGKRAADFYRP